MNEKDLNFRHLIKTLIPGFFTSISLIFLFDLILYLIFGKGSECVIMKVGLENPTIFVAALIPISMFTGIIVNTICFVYIFPKIKKNRSITEEGEKFKVFREKMLTKILDHYTEHFEIKDKDEFEYFFDEKSILLMQY